MCQLRLTVPAKRLWQALDAVAQDRALLSLRCARCEGAVPARDCAGRVWRGDLVLYGKCSVCGNPVFTSVEASCPDRTLHSGRFPEDKSPAPAAQIPILYGQRVPVVFSAAERKLVLGTGIEPELRRGLSLAVVDGDQVRVMLTLGELDDIIGSVAWASIATASATLYRRLEQLHDRLSEVELSYRECHDAT